MAMIGKLTENQFADLCEAVVENTANRLGLDPEAFAEASQNGEFLAKPIESMQDFHDLIMAIADGHPDNAKWQRACSKAARNIARWLDQFDAIKAKSGTGD